MGASDVFSLGNDGKVTVAEAGVYYVYAQVQSTKIHFVIST